MSSTINKSNIQTGGPLSDNQLSGSEKTLTKTAKTSSGSVYPASSYSLNEALARYVSFGSPDRTDPSLFKNDLQDNGPKELDLKDYRMDMEGLYGELTFLRSQLKELKEKGLSKNDRAYLDDLQSRLRSRLKSGLETLEREEQRVAGLEEKQRPFMEHGVPNSDWVGSRTLMVRREKSETEEILKRLKENSLQEKIGLMSEESDRLSQVVTDLEKGFHLIEQIYRAELQVRLHVSEGFGEVSEKYALTPVLKRLEELKREPDPSKRFAAYREFGGKQPLEQVVDELVTKRYLAGIENFFLGLRDSVKITARMERFLLNFSAFFGEMETGTSLPLFQKVSEGYRGILSKVESGAITVRAAKMELKKFEVQNHQLMEALKEEGADASKINQYLVGAALVVASGGVAAVAEAAVAPVLVETLGPGLGSFGIGAVNALSFVAAHRVFSAGISGDSSLIWDSKKSRSENFKSWGSEIAGAWMMMKFMKVFMGGYQTGFQGQIAAIAERRVLSNLVKSGRLGPSEVLGVEHLELVSNETQKILESMIGKSFLHNGSILSETAGLRTYQVLEQIAHHRGDLTKIQTEPALNTLCFVLALRMGNQLTHPLTVRMNEYASRKILEPLQKEIDTFKQDQASFFKSLTEGGLNPETQGIDFLKNQLSQVNRLLKIVQSIPEAYRNHELIAELTGQKQQIESIFNQLNIETPSETQKAIYPSRLQQEWIPQVQTLIEGTRQFFVNFPKQLKEDPNQIAQQMLKPVMFGLGVYLTAKSLVTGQGVQGTELLPFIGMMGNLVSPAEEAKGKEEKTAISSLRDPAAEVEVNELERWDKIAELNERMLQSPVLFDELMEKQNHFETEKKWFIEKIGKEWTEEIDSLFKLAKEEKVESTGEPHRFSGFLISNFLESVAYLHQIKGLSLSQKKEFLQKLIEQSKGNLVISFDCSRMILRDLQANPHWSSEQKGTFLTLLLQKIPFKNLREDFAFAWGIRTEPDFKICEEILNRLPADLNLLKSFFIGSQGSEGFIPLTRDIDPQLRKELLFSILDFEKTKKDFKSQENETNEILLQAAFQKLLDQLERVPSELRGKLVKKLELAEVSDLLVKSLTENRNQERLAEILRFSNLKPELVFKLSLQLLFSDNPEVVSAAIVLINSANYNIRDKVLSTLENLPDLFPRLQTILFENKLGETFLTEVQTGQNRSNRMILYGLYIHLSYQLKPTDNKFYENINNLRNILLGDLLKAGEAESYYGEKGVFSLYLQLLVKADWGRLSVHEVVPVLTKQFNLSRGEEATLLQSLRAAGTDSAKVLSELNHLFYKQIDKGGDVLQVLRAVYYFWNDSSFKPTHADVTIGLKALSRQLDVRDDSDLRGMIGPALNLHLPHADFKEIPEELVVSFIKNGFFTPGFARNFFTNVLNSSGGGEYVNRIIEKVLSSKTELEDLQFLLSELREFLEKNPTLIDKYPFEGIVEAILRASISTGLDPVFVIFQLIQPLLRIEKRSYPFLTKIFHSLLGSREGAQVIFDYCMTIGEHPYSDHSSMESKVFLHALKNSFQSHPNPKLIELLFSKSPFLVTVFLSKLIKNSPERNFGLVADLLKEMLSYQENKEGFVEILSDVFLEQESYAFISLRWMLFSESHSAVAVQVFELLAGQKIDGSSREGALLKLFAQMLVDNTSNSTAHLPIQVELVRRLKDHLPIFKFMFDCVDQALMMNSGLIEKDSQEKKILDVLSSFPEEVDVQRSFFSLLEKRIQSVLLRSSLPKHYLKHIGIGRTGNEEIENVVENLMNGLTVFLGLPIQKKSEVSLELGNLVRALQSVPLASSDKVSAIKSLAIEISNLLRDDQRFRHEIHNKFSSHCIAFVEKYLTAEKNVEKPDPVLIEKLERCLKWIKELYQGGFDTAVFKQNLSESVKSMLRFPSSDDPSTEEIAKLAISVREEWEAHRDTLSVSDTIALVQLAVGLEKFAFVRCDYDAKELSAPQQAEKISTLISVLYGSGYGNKGWLGASQRLGELGKLDKWDVSQQREFQIYAKLAREISLQVIDAYHEHLDPVVKREYKKWKETPPEHRRELGNFIGDKDKVAQVLREEEEEWANFTVNQYRMMAAFQLSRHLDALQVSGEGREVSRNVLKQLAGSLSVPFEARFYGDSQFSENVVQTGGKALGLHWLTGWRSENVPSGFVLPPRPASYRLKENDQKAVRDAVQVLEQKTGKKLGEGLKVSVRSGAAISMPGAMQTRLNVDSLEDVFRYVEEVYASWDSPAARQYRLKNGIPDEWGTAVNVVVMVDGTKDSGSGSGVVHSGAEKIHVAYSARHTGEVVVGGQDSARSPLPLDIRRELEKDILKFEKLYGEKTGMGHEVPIEVEFTVESGKLYYLQIRRALLSEGEKIEWYAKKVKKGGLTHEQAVKALGGRQHLEELKWSSMVDPNQIKPLMHEGTEGIGKPFVGYLAFDAAQIASIMAKGAKAVFVTDNPDARESTAEALQAGAILLVTPHPSSPMSHLLGVSRTQGLSVVEVTGGAGSIIKKGQKTALQVGNRSYRPGEVVTLEPHAIEEKQNTSRSRLYQGPMQLLQKESPHIKAIQFILGNESS